MMPRYDILVSDLCEEIDELREQRDYYKKMYEEERNKFSAHIDQSLKNSWEGMGNWMNFLLNTKQTDEGLLIIQKQDQ